MAAHLSPLRCADGCEGWGWILGKFINSLFACKSKCMSSSWNRSQHSTAVSLHNSFSRTSRFTQINPPFRTFHQPIRLLSQPEHFLNYSLKLFSLHKSLILFSLQHTVKQKVWQQQHVQLLDGILLFCTAFQVLFFTTLSEFAHFLITLLKSISCVPADTNSLPKIRRHPLQTESFPFYAYFSTEIGSVMFSRTSSKLICFVLTLN